MGKEFICITERMYYGKRIRYDSECCLPDSFVVADRLTIVTGIDG